MRACTHLDDDLASRLDLVDQGLLVRGGLALLAPQGAEDGVGLDRLGQGGVDQRHAVHRVLAEEHVLLEQLADLGCTRCGVGVVLVRCDVMLV